MTPRNFLKDAIVAAMPATALLFFACTSFAAGPDRIQVNFMQSQLRAVQFRRDSPKRSTAPWARP